MHTPHTSDHPIHLDEAQRIVHEWITKVGKGYFSEMTNLAQLMEEVGEVARIFARTYGEQVAKQEEIKKEMADELADVFFVLLCLCNQTNTNLSEAFKKNIDKKTNRDNHRF